MSRESHSCLSLCKFVPDSSSCCQSHCYVSVYTPKLGTSPYTVIVMFKALNGCESVTRATSASKASTCRNSMYTRTCEDLGELSTSSVGYREIGFASDLCELEQDWISSEIHACMQFKPYHPRRYPERSLSAVPNTSLKRLCHKSVCLRSYLTLR